MLNPQRRFKMEVLKRGGRPLVRVLVLLRRVVAAENIECRNCRRRRG